MGYEDAKADVKKTMREADEKAKETWRRADGEESVSDKVANLGDDIRNELGNAGDNIRREADELHTDVEDKPLYIIGSNDRIEAARRNPAGGFLIPETGAWS